MFVDAEAKKSFNGNPITFYCAHTCRRLLCLWPIRVTSVSDVLISCAHLSQFLIYSQKIYSVATATPQHSGEDHLIQTADRLPTRSLLPSFSYQLRVIHGKSNLAATEAHLQETINLIRRPVRRFSICIVCWHISPISYHCRVFTKLQLGRYSCVSYRRKKFQSKARLNFLFAVCWHFTPVSNHLRVIRDFKPVTDTRFQG